MIMVMVMIILIEYTCSGHMGSGELSFLISLITDLKTVCRTFHNA